MEIRLLFILILGLFVQTGSQAEVTPYFTFTEDVRLAYQRALELRVGESSILLSKEKSNAPNNYMVYFVENYLDFMRVLSMKMRLLLPLLQKTRIADWR